MTRANAKSTLADQGINPGAGVKDLIKEGLGLATNIAGAVTGGGKVANVLSGREAAPADAGTPPAAPTADKKDSPWLWIGIGSGVVVLGAILIWYFNRR